jgi:hypothetical protein
VAAGRSSQFDSSCIDLLVNILRIKSDRAYCPAFTAIDAILLTVKAGLGFRHGGDRVTGFYDRLVKILYLPS